MGKKNRGPQTWFTSDPHFGHDNVLDFCKRPFKDMEDMMNQMRDKHNAKVNPEDTVIYVGDIFFYIEPKKCKEYLDSLNGMKVLVRGNHDRKARDMLGRGFDFVVEEMVMVIANERVTISHYPFKAPAYIHHYFNLRAKLYKLLGKKGAWSISRRFYDRRPDNKGQFLLHGHTHGSEKVMEYKPTFLDRLFFNRNVRHRQIHVGVDAWDFEPIPVGEIGNLICKIKREEIERSGVDNQKNNKQKGRKK
jgi:calcineurin-like phosphoesterase family protein